MSFDNDITLSHEQVRGFGLEDTAQAIRNFALLKDKIGPAFSEFMPAVTAALASSADPDMALNNLERFTEAVADIPLFIAVCQSNPQVLACLMTIFGASRFLSTFLVVLADACLPTLSDPEYLLRPSGKQRLAEHLTRITGDELDDRQFFRKLRVFRKQQMLRIGLRDLLGRADLQETVSELSDLAEVSLQHAYEWVDAGLRGRYGRPLADTAGALGMAAGFAVMAMGKLGGRELNFSSDVDLMYVYSEEGETEGVPDPAGQLTGRITNHQYFIKLAEKISAAIGDKTEDGFVFRVDLRLRPAGKQGPLAQSLSGYEIYYESWGQTWERSALLKARPVAGDEAVGREFLRRISPFIYRKYLDYSAIAEIRDMKRKINKEVELKGRLHRDVKLGYGGIREIEFLIQALQLIHAGRDRSLREGSSLRALHRLSQKGLITYEEHSLLLKAYVFLRTVEHRIQILDDLQSQTLPLDARELRVLARRTGYLEQGREADTLLGDYAEYTRTVRILYDDLLAYSGEESASDSSGGEYALLLDDETSEQDAVDVLKKCGFHDPWKAFRNLIFLREGPAFVHQTPRSRKLFQEIFPRLFQEIISSADPDLALLHLESFLAAQGSWEAFQSMVKLDVDTVKILVAVFANSAYLSRMLISRPVLLQNMLDARRTAGVGISEVFRRELENVLGKSPDLSEKLDALRRFKKQEELRIGMADLFSGLPLPAVCRELSKLAEACLGAALELATVELGKKIGLPLSSSGLAVIGVGKLGSRELTYGSDLDILFVYSADRAVAQSGIATTFELFTKIAEKTISFLSTLTREGLAFRVDTRLRPMGSKGPLVQSIEAFRNYYAVQAETWERQALLRARFVAGDRIAGAEFSATLMNCIFREIDPVVLAHEISAMRKRMEDELGKSDAAHHNIKQGAGGLVDIEFLVQFLQLVHGKKHPRVRVPGAWNGLRALHAQKLLDQADYEDLKASYLFFRGIESRMRIVANQATSELSRDASGLRPLAKRMGYHDNHYAAGEKLLRDYEATAKRVRSIFNKILFLCKP